MAWKANGALLHFGEKGMEALPRAIADTLALEENVEIKLNSPVKAVDYESRNGTVMVMVSPPRPSPVVWFLYSLCCVSVDSNFLL